MFAAVVRGGAARLPERAGGGTTTKRADLICAVGRSAGGPQTSEAAAAVAESDGVALLAMVSGGRSTVLAVEPERSQHVLERLHALFFSEAGVAG